MRCWVLVVVCGVMIGVTAGSAFAATQTLEQVLTLAYENNPALQAARAKLQATDEQVSQALSGWRPSVEATAEGGKSWQKNSGDAGLPHSSQSVPRNLGVNVTQPIFSGFRTIAGVRGAEATVLAQRAALVEAEQQLLLDAATAYIDVVQDQSILEMNRNNEQALRRMLAEVTDRRRIGELKRTDVNQAESRLNIAVAARLQAENDLASRRAAFKRLVGDMPGTLAAPTLALDEVKDGAEVVALAEKQNPSLLAAGYAQDAARADVTAAEGALLPEVSLVGRVSRGWEQSAALPDRQDDATIIARVTLPLYKAGSDYSKTRAAKQTVTQRRLEREDALHKAQEEAENAWRALTTARATIAANKDAVTANDKALEGVREESKVGTRTTLDVLNAEQELLSAKVSLVKAQRDESVAMLKIKSAIGLLTAQALRLPVASYDPKAYYEDVSGKWVGLGDGDE